jgi:hypothetical protein
LRWVYLLESKSFPSAGAGKYSNVVQLKAAWQEVVSMHCRVPVTHVSVRSSADHVQRGMETQALKLEPVGENGWAMGEVHVLE